MPETYLHIGEIVLRKSIFVLIVVSVLLAVASISAQDLPDGTELPDGQWTGTKVGLDQQLAAYRSNFRLTYQKDGLLDVAILWMGSEFALEIPISDLTETTVSMQAEERRRLDAFLVNYVVRLAEEEEIVLLSYPNGYKLSRDMEGQVFDVACPGESPEVAQVYYIGASGDERFSAVHSAYVITKEGGFWWPLTTGASSGSPVTWFEDENDDISIIPFCG